MTYICTTKTKHAIRVTELSEFSPQINYEVDNISLDLFLDILIKINLKQLNNTQRNIITDYDLEKHEIDLIESEFRFSHLELQIIILTKLQKLINIVKNSESETFMITVLELSISAFQNIIRHNLKNLGGKITQLTEWGEQTLKDKISRQQCKIAVHVIERNICNILNVCYDKIFYTEYLTHWFRQLMSTRAYNLKAFFSSVSEYINSNVLTFKTNINFRKRIKDIIRSNSKHQRDIIDYIDEVLTKGNETLKKIATIKLKKITSLLIQLVQLVDNNYDLNIENVKILKDIHLKFVQWSNKGDLDLESILTSAIQNMQLNIRIWPLRVQGKIDLIWSKIIKY